MIFHGAAWGSIFLIPYATKIPVSVPLPILLTVIPVMYILVLLRSHKKGAVLGFAEIAPWGVSTLASLSAFLFPCAVRIKYFRCPLQCIVAIAFGRCITSSS